MAIIRVPVKITYPGEGGPGMNVLHVRTVADPPGSALSDALEAITTFYEFQNQNFPVGITITIGESMVLDPLGTPTYLDDEASTVGGAGSSEIAPQLLAIVCSWRTTSATRSGRGRTFVGPLSKTALDSNGTPTSDVHGRTLEAAQDLVAASVAAAGWSVGVLSIKQGLLRDIVGVSVRDRFSYLSSRRD